MHLDVLSSWPHDHRTVFRQHWISQLRSKDEHHPLELDTTGCENPNLYFYRDIGKGPLLCYCQKKLNQCFKLFPSLSKTMYQKFLFTQWRVFLKKTFKDNGLVCCYRKKSNFYLIFTFKVKKCFFPTFTVKLV